MQNTQECAGSKSVFHEWAEVTTAHGFVDFSRAKTSLSKVLWFILIFISLTLMIYQLYRVMSDYTKHDWVTTINQQAAGPDGIKFPSVIVCNSNRLKWSKAEEYNMTVDMISYLFLQTELGNYFKKDAAANNFAVQFIDWRKQHNFSFLDIFDNIGPACEDIFITGICDNAKYTIDTIFTYEYGRCLRLNFNLTADFVGVLGGATLFLDVQSWDYVPLVYNNYISEGLMLQLTYSENAELGQWIKLHPGTQTAIGLQQVETTVEVQDRSIFNPFTLIDSKPPCALNPQLKYGNGTYSIDSCLTECYSTSAILGCSCFPYVPNDHYRTCEAEELKNCMDGNVTQYNNTEEMERAMKAIQKSAEDCYIGCEQPCYDSYLETQVSFTTFPSKTQRNQFKEYLTTYNLSHVDMNDVIYLEIYFTTLKTEVVKLYESMSLEDLISNSGGLIGVWAGMSFLTVFQAIAYVIKFFETRKMRKKHKNCIKPREIQFNESVKSVDSWVSAPRAQ